MKKSDINVVGQVIREVAHAQRDATAKKYATKAEVDVLLDNISDLAVACLELRKRVDALERR